MTTRDDRRHVRFAGEGRAGSVTADPGGMYVHVSVDNRKLTCWLPLQLVEFIPEPLKIGDEIRPGDDPEPRIGSLLVSKNGCAIKRVRGGWTFASDDNILLAWDHHLGSGTSWRVAWLPGVVA